MGAGARGGDGALGRWVIWVGASGRWRCWVGSLALCGWSLRHDALARLRPLATWRRPQAWTGDRVAFNPYTMG